jgi:hypothetical protein
VVWSSPDNFIWDDWKGMVSMTTNALLFFVPWFFPDFLETGLMTRLGWMCGTG